MELETITDVSTFLSKNSSCIPTPVINDKINLELLDIENLFSTMNITKDNTNFCNVIGFKVCYYNSKLKNIYKWDIVKTFRDIKELLINVRYNNMILIT